MICRARSVIGVTYITGEIVVVSISVLALPVRSRRPTGRVIVTGNTASTAAGHRIGHMAEGTGSAHSAIAANARMAETAGGRKGGTGPVSYTHLTLPTTPYV